MKCITPLLLLYCTFYLPGSFATLAGRSYHHEETKTTTSTLVESNNIHKDNKFIRSTKQRDTTNRLSNTKNHKRFTEAPKDKPAHLTNTSKTTILSSRNILEQKEDQQRELSTDCTDDSTYYFITKNDELKSCAWLSSKVSRQSTYCNTKGWDDSSKKMVKFYCSASCQRYIKECRSSTASPASLPSITDPDDEPTLAPTTVTTTTSSPTQYCIDDPSHTFIIQGGKVRDCTWFGDDISRKQKYCDGYAGGKKKVKYSCRQACRQFINQCRVETPAPTRIPSNGPTLVPSSIPTSVPTSPPSTSPTEYCYDDASYEFIIKDGRKRNCAWLDTATKKSKYCEIKGVKHLVKYHCRDACQKYLKECAIATEVPSSSPSNIPSFDESGMPSADPSPVPSSIPTEFCADDDDFTFTNSKGKQKDCEWLSLDIERQGTYCDTNGSDGLSKKKVKFACRGSCSDYLAECMELLPTSSPTAAPTIYETLSPTEYCSDDPNFTFIIKAGFIMKDCEWLSIRAERQVEWCDTNGYNDSSKKKIKFSCRGACQDFLSRCGELTQIPSDVPSTVPSSIPSMSPVISSEVPSNKPTEYCYDDISYRFTINGVKDKGCNWLSETEKRQLDWCDTKGYDNSSNQQVKYYCRDTCKMFLEECEGARPSFVPTTLPTTLPSSYPSTMDDDATSAPSSFECVDDPTYKFENINGKMSSCSWLSAKTIRKNNYCDTYGSDSIADGMVKDYCRDTCKAFLGDLCTGEFLTDGSELPSMSPSVAPSENDGSTSSPTEFCTDDSTYKFMANTGNREDCSWLAESEERVDEYCETNGFNGSSKKKVKFSCRDTCSKYLNRCPGETSKEDGESPSSVPSESNTPAPTEYCVDSDVYRFQVNSGEKKGCSWLSNKVERATKYCDGYDDYSGSVVKFSCRDTCKSYLSACSDSPLDTASPSSVPSFGASSPPTSSSTESDSGSAIPSSTTPTLAPSDNPIVMASSAPSSVPSSVPITSSPVEPNEGSIPSSVPTKFPSSGPTSLPSSSPSSIPSSSQSSIPTSVPFSMPSSITLEPTSIPSLIPSLLTLEPTTSPSTPQPTASPSMVPSLLTPEPTSLPSTIPTSIPSESPSSVPSETLTSEPSTLPSDSPTSMVCEENADDRYGYKLIYENGVVVDVKTRSCSFLQGTSEEKRIEFCGSDFSYQNIEKAYDVCVVTCQKCIIESTIPPSDVPTYIPSSHPIAEVTLSPTKIPSETPSDIPTDIPSKTPSLFPSSFPSSFPITAPPTSDVPTYIPSSHPTTSETTLSPTKIPSETPSDIPTDISSKTPSLFPSSLPSSFPITAPPTSDVPTYIPSSHPTTAETTLSPTKIPSETPSDIPTDIPLKTPSMFPSSLPSSFSITAPPTVTPCVEKDNDLFVLKLKYDDNGIVTGTVTRKCSWLSEEKTPSQISDICATDYYFESRKSAADTCKVTCGVCEVAVPSPNPSSSVRTEMPSQIPTSIPSQIPSDTPCIEIGRATFGYNYIYDGGVVTGVDTRDCTFLQQRTRAQIEDICDTDFAYGDVQKASNVCVITCESCLETEQPSSYPTMVPTKFPSSTPTEAPSDIPSNIPSGVR